MNNRSVLFWSGGKDCMLALEQMYHNGHPNVSYLVTTYDESTNRVPFHGVHINLIRAQAYSLQIPLIPVPLPHKSSNKVYQDTIIKQLVALEKERVTNVIFGDIFLKDLRSYKESLLEKTRLTACFPLWGKSTEELSQYFITEGYEAVISGVDRQLVNDKYLGQKYNQGFIDNLSSEVDHCGENGEFHTFTFDGPRFTEPIFYKENEERKTFFDKYGYIELDVKER